MSLIVEDGSGMTNADAFIPVSFADEYHTAMGNPTWAGDALKEAAIRRATAFLSNSYQWQGYKRQGRPQSLAWPRVDVVDREGWGVAFDAVPIEIQKATAEIALRELVSPGSMNPDFLASEQVKREGAARSGIPERQHVGSVGAAGAAHRPGHHRAAVARRCRE